MATYHSCDRCASSTNVETFEFLLDKEDRCVSSGQSEPRTLRVDICQKCLSTFGKTLLSSVTLHHTTTVHSIPWKDLFHVAGERVKGCLL